VGIYEEDHLYHLMKIFGRGVHRVPVFRRVFDKNAGAEIDQICGVISQSNVIEYLYKNGKEVLGDFADRSISEIKGLIVPRPYIYSVHEDYPAWNAFKNVCVGVWVCVCFLFFCSCIFANYFFFFFFTHTHTHTHTISRLFFSVNKTTPS
jgi:hypothetical protein